LLYFGGYFAKNVVTLYNIFVICQLLRSKPDSADS